MGNRWRLLGAKASCQARQRAPCAGMPNLFPLMQWWGMREAAERQMAEVREMLKNRRRPEIIQVETTLDEEEGKRREAMRQREAAARRNEGRR